MDRTLSRAKRRLRLWVWGFFAALAVPSAILVFKANDQLQWEAFHVQQTLAQGLARRVDEQFSELITDLEARAFADFGFLVVTGDPSAGFLQRSPLSDFPVDARIPGLIGYFQIDATGEFSTPLLPGPGRSATTYGVTPGERQARADLQSRIHAILGSNALVTPERRGTVAAATSEGGSLTSKTHQPVGRAQPSGLPSPAPGPAARSRVLEDVHVPTDAVGRQDSEQEAPAPSQAAFDALSEMRSSAPKRAKQPPPGSLGRIEDLKLQSALASRVAKSEAVGESQGLNQVKVREARKERAITPSPEPTAAEVWDAPLAASEERDESPRPAPPIRMFESAIDPFEFSLLDSGHLVFYRKVWREGQRFIQGALIDQSPLIDAMVGAPFRDSTLSSTSSLIVTVGDTVLAAFAAPGSRSYEVRLSELRGELLYRTPLTAPLGAMHLVFSVGRLPVGPGASVIGWTAAVLALVLGGGLVLMLRLGTRQIDLIAQQQAFVSAVSHELKTPLTSIRMYSEMLCAGWADETRKADYYRYIRQESERLSRLIANVLQLARMTRNELRVEPIPMAVSDLMESVGEGIRSTLEQTGFTLDLECTPGLQVLVDPDALTQILINLVDNGVKFAAGSEPKEIRIRCERTANAKIQFSVRDFGPGIPREQLKRIFQLFYRIESTLTRETMGTGIGLALVKRLTEAMGGSVDVVNQSPGAEFRVTVPEATGTPAETATGAA